MVIYILSIIFYVATLFMGIAKQTKKARYLSVIVFVVTLINLYLVFSSYIQSSFLVNLLLSIPHIAVLIVAGLFIIVPIKPEHHEKPPDIPLKQESNVIDQPLDVPVPQPFEKKKESEPEIQEKEEDIEESEDVNYKNIPLAIGNCDISGDIENFTVTINNKNGEPSTFCVHNGQIIGFLSNTNQFKRYEG